MVLPKSEEGQGLVEYSLILFLVAITLVVALMTLGDELVLFFENIEQALKGTQ